MKAHAIAAAWGLLGMGLALLLWHGWVDHQTWHTLLANLAQQQRTQKAP